MNLREINTHVVKILDIAEKSFNDGILSKDTLEEIKNNFKKNNIKIGICGQVKTGKSTFVNSYFFGKNILPTASTPMTAALSYIKYGEKPSVEVEFFTEEEWKRIIELGSKKEEGDTEEIKAAKEYIEFSKSIKNEISNFLGKKIDISYDKIANYVGSEGKYTPIVKSLSIYLPVEILKYIEIVDTPGTNDPVVSREQRTLEFLKEADVIFLFCYSGRPFDESDRALLRRLKNSVGKVIIIINKKDIILSEEGGEDKVLQRFREQIKQLINEMVKSRGNLLVIDMLEKAKDKIILFSSLWALLGKTSESEIKQNKDLSYYFEKFKEEYPSLKTQADFLKSSGITEIDFALKEVLREKDEILLRKPINLINFSYEEKKKEYKKEIDSYEREKRNYEYVLKDIEEELEKLKEIEAKIKNDIVPKSSYEIRKRSKEFLRESKNVINDLLNDEYESLKRSIPEKGTFSFHSTYCLKCEDIFDEKFRKTKIKVKNLLDDRTNKLSEGLKEPLKEILSEISNLGNRLLITKKEYYEFITEAENSLSYDLDGILQFTKESSFHTDGTWFTMTSKARDSIINQISKVFFEEYMPEIEDYLSELERNILKYLQNIMSTIQYKVIQKIIEPLERSEINYKDKQARIVEIDKLIKDLNIKFAEIENKHNIIKKELNI